MHIPALLDYRTLKPTRPSAGDILLYDPARKTFRINHGGFRLQWLGTDRYHDEWDPNLKGPWAKKAVEIAKFFGLHVQQDQPTAQKHPRFILSARKE